jgi:hypothetical protein
LGESAKKRVTRQEVADFTLDAAQREELKRALLRIIGRPATGTVTVQLGQGGVSGVRLVENELKH